MDLNILGVEKYKFYGGGYIYVGCPLSIYAERDTHGDVSSKLSNSGGW